jgi:hypothetical protein
MSPGGEGVLVLRPFQGSARASGSSFFFLSHLFTYMFLHPPHEAGESICATFEACIHASEAAQAPNDHVGLIDFFLKQSDSSGVLINQ